MDRPDETDAPVEVAPTGEAGSEDGDAGQPAADDASAAGTVEELERRLRVDAEEIADLRFANTQLQWRLTRIRNRGPYALARVVRDVARGHTALRRVPGETVKAIRSGERTPAPKRPPRLETELDTAALAALDSGDLDRALELAEESLAENPARLSSLDIRKTALYRRGDISEAVTTVRRMRASADTPALADLEAQLLGRIRETDPAWLPHIPGPTRPIEPRGRYAVMHLLKESRPNVNGYCMRSHYSLLSQRAAGLDPFVVTSLGFPRKQGVTQVPAVDHFDGLAHFRLDLGAAYPAGAPFDQVLRDQAWLTARIAHRELPSIIHAGSGFRGYEPALIGMALRDHLHRPLVYEARSFFESTWTDDISRSERGEYYQRRFDTENRCMLAADVVITIAEAMREEIIAARGIPAERVFVIPNGVDPEAFRPKPKDPQLARKYGVAGKQVFGYVSNLDHPREGQELLIEATALMRSQGRDVACLIVGDGGRRAKLEQRAWESGVGEAVVFTGRIPHDQVADLYALIDVFVVPRRDERAARLVTPLKPFEAMALGKPVVVSDLPALVELAKPGERGLAYEPEDAGALATEVLRLFDDDGLRNRLAEQGRRWVLTERTWAANGPRYRAIYDEVLDAWAAGRRVGT